MGRLRAYWEPLLGLVMTALLAAVTAVARLLSVLVATGIIDDLLSRRSPTTPTHWISLVYSTEGLRLN